MEPYGNITYLFVGNIFSSEENRCASVSHLKEKARLQNGNKNAENGTLINKEGDLTSQF